MDRTELAARLLATFVDELEEQLRTLDEDLIALERDPADVEHLRSVFRVAHTLKGAARAAGVRGIEEVCHALEAMCAGARDAGAPLSASQVSLLFAGSDALADAGRRIREGGDAGSSTAVTELLQELRRRGNVGDHPARPTSAMVIQAPPSHAPNAAAAPRAVAEKPPAAPVAASAHGPKADAAVPAPAPAVRDDHRLGAGQLDSLITVAGELLGVTGTIGDRPAAAEALADSVRAWRTEWRREAATHRRSLEKASASPALIDAMTSVDDRLARLDRQVGDLVRALGEDARTLGGTTSRLVDNVRRLRMRPFADIAESLPRAARDVAASLDKEVRVTVKGADVEADRTVLDSLREPLLHLIRNAVDHGLEASAVRVSQGKPAEGCITVRAELGGDRLLITVADDGAGLDIAAIRRALAEHGRHVPADDHAVARTLFDSGFSTRRVATAISGRGVGLDIVRTSVERLGGTVDVDYTLGAGTKFTIETPVSVATLRALIVLAGGQTFAIPTTFLDRMIRIPRGDVRVVEGRTMLTIDKSLVPLRSLAKVLGPPLEEPGRGPDLNVVVLCAVGHRLALMVDETVDERVIVVRPLDHTGEETAASFSGASLIDGTRVVLVVNAPALVNAIGRGEGRAASIDIVLAAAPARQCHILVVDDSITTRTLEHSVLSAAGYRVTTAVNGVDAWRLIMEGGIDLVVSDVEMPMMGGLELAEQIRASASHARLPVILVTSLDKPEERVRGLEAGANAYIMKSSFDQDLLLGIVRQLLGKAT